MRVLVAQGAVEVAGLLRALAEDVEQGTAEVGGYSVDVSRSLRATVDLSDDGSGVCTRLDLHLWRPTPPAWDAKELRMALSHPGD
jgi:hypothetical protein